jgi:hypothetical protein
MFSMKTEKSIPVFVSVVTIILGSYDLLRGFMHTIVLNYSAKNIAVLDLSTSTASDQLRLLGAFGISNLETGVVLILIGFYARPIALAMLGVIPLVYFIGHWGITANIASYAPTTANWGGAPWLVVYLCICATTFIAGVIVMLKKKSSSLS